MTVETIGLEKLKRTAMCASFTKENINEIVTLMGWVQKRRDLGGVIFVDLRDRTGIMQVVFNAEKCNDDFQIAESIRTEYVIAIKGVIVARAPETINPNIETGEIEVHASMVKLLSSSETPPFAVDEEKVSESLRLKYRYIDLRRKELQHNLIMRHRVTQRVHRFLDGQEFLNIETPMLIKSTPEGARDYLVPSRVHPGCFYALPQSPQMFKQILMLAGYDKYYQIVKCFRDEDLRADRQPEFTQIDIEMSFVDVDDVISVNEKLLADIFGGILEKEISIPFPRLSYAEAMERFGCDKPDTRFGLEIKNITELVNESEFQVFTNAIKNGGSVRAINAKGAAKILPRKEIDALIEVVKPYRAKGLAWIQVSEDGLKSPIIKFLSTEQINAILSKLNAETGDLLLFVADVDEIVFASLAHLRLHLGKRLNLINKEQFNFVWVTEFPLVEYDAEQKRYVAVHHPFTSPMDEDIELLKTNPQKVRSKAYDIVLNGVELGGGSIRIHNSETQAKMFSLLGFSDEEAKNQFGYLLDAFKYGTPPHGGIAFGLDRMLMLMTKSESIRDVIAFPKVQNASDLMTQAPTFVSKKQMEELHLSIIEEEIE